VIESMIYCYGFRVAMCIELRARVKSLMSRDKLPRRRRSDPGNPRGKWVQERSSYGCVVRKYCVCVCVCVVSVWKN
jgi:hypothetical protein